MINVHIVDDHKLLAEGLEKMINESETAKVSDISHTIDNCRKRLMSKIPDVLLLDLSLPDGSGIDFCKEIKTTYPEIKVLILTTHNEFAIARSVLNNGASGYILKNALSEELLMGIEAVMNGETFLCEEIDITLKKSPKHELWLTTREREIVKLIMDGYDYNEIAQKTFLSPETIKTYRKSLLAKVGVKNSAMLIKTVIEKKLI